jgi:hypothetical protein
MLCSTHTYEHLQSKLQEWEELVRSDDKVSAVEARLQKDIKNLKREKQVLSEDVEVRMGNLKREK